MSATSITFSDELYVSANQDFTFDIETGGEFNQYQWFKGDVPISDISSNSFYTHTVTENDFGLYHCEVTNTLVIDLIISSTDIELIDSQIVPLSLKDYRERWNTINDIVYTNGNLWMITPNGLIQLSLITAEYHYNNRNDLELLWYDTLKTLTVDTSNNVWLGSDRFLHKIEHKINKDKYRHTRLLNNHFKINSILSINDEKVWISTDKGILVKFGWQNDFTRLLTYNKENSPLLDNYIEAVCTYTENRLIIGTRKGLVVCTPNGENRYKTFENYDYEIIDSNNSNLKDDNIKIVYPDKNGDIYIVTKGEGLQKAAAENLYKFKSSKFKSSCKNISSILIDTKKILWVATFDSGLYAFKDNKWKRFNFKNSKLETNHITKIICDKENNIWIATPSGLFVYRSKSRSKYWNSFLNKGNYSTNDKIIKIDLNPDVFNFKKFNINKTGLHKNTAELFKNEIKNRHGSNYYFKFDTICKSYCINTEYLNVKREKIYDFYKFITTNKHKPIKQSYINNFFDVPDNLYKDLYAIKLDTINIKNIKNILQNLSNIGVNKVAINNPENWIENYESNYKSIFDTNYYYNEFNIVENTLDSLGFEIMNGNVILYFDATYPRMYACHLGSVPHNYNAEGDLSWVALLYITRKLIIFEKPKHVSKKEIEELFTIKIKNCDGGEITRVTDFAIYFMPFEYLTKNLIFKKIFKL